VKVPFDLAELAGKSKKDADAFSKQAGKLVKS